VSGAAENQHASEVSGEVRTSANEICPARDHPERHAIPGTTDFFLDFVFE
jgi:hypothetical protein